MTFQRIRFEICSRCQLACPLCDASRRAQAPGIIGWGYLKFEKFKKFLDKNPLVKEIGLSWLGEIFLNPDIGKILKYAFEKGVVLDADGGVNLNSVSDDILRDLVKYKVASITVAIDGASQGTYVKYRRRGNFRKVIKNIMTINKYKRQYCSKLPVLSWQFIIFGHNEHEIPIARKLAAKLGMNFFTKLSWDKNFSPVRDPEFVKRATGSDFVSRKEYAFQSGEDYMDRVCHDLWDKPVINWDGNLFGCCKNKSVSFGNVFNSGLESALKGEQYRYMKEMLLGEKPPRADIVCTKCPVFKNRKKQVGIQRQ